MRALSLSALGRRAGVEALLLFRLARLPTAAPPFARA
jgi:hypothetical protein